MIDNQISEKYRKYLIKLKIKSKVYYTANGSCLEGNDDDKYLHDSKGVFVFNTLQKLKSFIESDGGIFDKVNFQKWSRKISEQNTYAFYDFDEALKELEKESFNSTNSHFKNNEGIKEIFQILMLSEDLFEILNVGLDPSNTSNFMELEKFKEFYFDNFVFKKDAVASVTFNTFKLKNEIKIILSTMEKLFNIHS